MSFHPFISFELGRLLTLSLVGIPLISYSPLSRGWLSGQIKSLDDLHKQDYRRRLPRFQPAVFDENL